MPGSFLSAATWNLRLLERRWQRAQPFPHIVLQKSLDEAACAELTAALDEEPAERLAGEIYEVMATGRDFEHPTLTAFTDELESDEVLAAVSAISGKRVTRVKARGYAFSAGHYLLPHADRDTDALRQIAFALYVAVSPHLEGGELELFDCQVELGQIIATEPAGRILPEAGTLVLFDVSDRSLHQVREVLAGTRASISGWFY